MRILSLHPSATEILFAIGAGSMLVGRTDKCNYPEAAIKVPSIGDPQDVSTVLVEVFEPHLVLTGPGQRELSQELGKSSKIVYFDPQSLDDLFSGIAGLAELLGKQVEADLVVHELRSVLELIKQKARKFHKVRVYCEVSHNSVRAASGYVSELIEIAGGKQFSGPVNIEELKEFDPQVVISCVPGEEEFNFELLMARDGWKDLNAINHERLFSLPESALYRPGPRLIQGVKRLAKILHGIEVGNAEH